MPMLITAVHGDMATIVAEGLEQRCSLALAPEAKVGEYVLVHAGFAITVLDEADADERLSIFAELQALEEDEYRHS